MGEVADLPRDRALAGTWIKTQEVDQEELTFTLNLEMTGSCAFGVRSSIEFEDCSWNTQTGYLLIQSGHCPGVEGFYDYTVMNNRLNLFNGYDDCFDRSMFIGNWVAE